MCREDAIPDTDGNGHRITTALRFSSRALNHQNSDQSSVQNKNSLHYERIPSRLFDCNIW